jgi:hypothetical protein
LSIEFPRFKSKHEKYFFRGISGNFMKITGFGPGNSLQIPGNYLEK